MNADLAIADRNPFALPAEELYAVCNATFLAGESVPLRGWIQVQVYA